MCNSRCRCECGSIGRPAKCLPRRCGCSSSRFRCGRRNSTRARRCSRLAQYRCNAVDRLHNHRFGIRLGLGDARGGFGRRARARGGVGLGGGGRAGRRARLGRRQRAGAAGYRRARHGWAERGGRRGRCRRRAGIGHFGIAAQVDAARSTGFVHLHYQLPVAVVDVAVAVLAVCLARHVVIGVVFQHVAHPTHAARGHVAVGVIAVGIAIR